MIVLVLQLRRVYNHSIHSLLFVCLGNKRQGILTGDSVRRLWHESLWMKPTSFCPRNLEEIKRRQSSVGVGLVNGSSFFSLPSETFGANK